jgi:hypothetical protein
MRRDEQTQQSRNKTNKQKTNTHKDSTFRNNRVSALVVLVLLLQYPELVLIFKQRLCISLARCLGSLTSFSSVFQWQLLSQ